MLSICEFNKSHKTNFVVLIETHVQASRVQQLKQKMGYEGVFCVDSVRREGGLAVLWRKAESMTLMGFSQNHVDMEVVGDVGDRWRLTPF